MRDKLWGVSKLLPVLLLCALSSAQVKQEQRTVVVNGKSGNASSVQVNGRTFVDLEGIARIASGSLGFQGAQLTLTVPCAPRRSGCASSRP